jgi:NAD(P)-dependent dehydrogenase (short-subunit alcohol dehydrogenase family)
MSATRIAVVTGAGSGIGEATTRVLVERGDQVLMVGRDEDRLRRAQERIGGEATRMIAVDITEDSAADAVVAAALEHWGRIDTLVNNAGVYRHGELSALSMSEFDETFAINVRAPYALTRAAVPHMGRGSSIVFVGSNLSRVGKPGASAYAASKAAVESLTKTLAVELGDVGIRANAVSPGMTRTEMTAANFEDTARYEQLVAMSPVGFLGEARDIANAIAFLSSDDARYINGTSVLIDGGRTLR